MVTYANDNEDSLKSRHPVASTYYGVDLPRGAPMTVIAMTTDCDVAAVSFIWKNTAKQVVHVGTKRVYTNGTTFDSELVHYANSTFTQSV